MRTVRFEVAYDGTRFHGWQRQDGFDSVQQTLEEGLAALLDGVVTVHGAGRTDTGVHGLRQVAHAQVATRLEDDRLRHALNAHVGEGVVEGRRD
jgi:tRNA pseudouridine38-40 synthase